MKHLVLSIIMLVSFLAINIFLLPNEKPYKDAIYQSNTELSQLWDNTTNHYADVHKAVQLQTKVEALQDTEDIFRFVKGIFYLFIWAVLAVWIAGFTQFLFTNIDFTNGYHDGVLRMIYFVSGVVTLIFMYLFILK